MTIISMADIEIPLPAGVDARRIEDVIETAVVQTDLEIAIRDGLKKYPGCVHWHVKAPGRRGTLEVTFWPEVERAWFMIRTRREADWMAEKVRKLQRAIADGCRLK